MRRTGTILSLAIVASIALTISQSQAQEIAPAPPAIEGEVMVQQETVADVPLPLPSVESLPCDSASDACCTYDPGATCCGVEPYRCRCCGHIDCYAPGIHKRKRNGKICWCRYWTTGDMHPHYAYYPQYHGYYYFRPYNYTNVLEHKELIVALGGSRTKPYSVAMFDRFYNEYYEENPIITPIILDRSTVPGATQLPRLEELLVE